MNYVEWIQLEADRVFANKAKANAWLTQPIAALGNQSPIELTRDEAGYLRAKDALERIDHGYAG